MSMEKMSTKPFEYLFQRPGYDDSLGLGANVAIAKGALASRMTQEERTRTYHPDGRLENVAEHSYMVAKVALSIRDTLYPWLDRGKVAIYALDHDDVEGWVGDTPTDSIANHDPQLKKEIEEKGAEQLAEEYAPLVPHYVDDVMTYEKQEELEAQFVRIVDKFAVLLIHIPNEGATLREHYTYEQYIQSVQKVESKLLEQYPEWIELIEMRTELALYIGQKYMHDWEDSPATARTAATKAASAESTSEAS